MNNSTADTYDVETIELKWQDRWQEAGAEATPEPRGEGHGTYVFNTPPFTSGEAHMGHVRSCSIGDSYARFRRRRGTRSSTHVGSTPSDCPPSSAHSITT